MNSMANFTILANDDPYGVFQISENFRPIQVDEQYRSKLGFGKYCCCYSNCSKAGKCYHLKTKK